MYFFWHLVWWKCFQAWQKICSNIWYIFWLGASFPYGKEGTHIKLYLFCSNVIKFLPKWLRTEPKNRYWLSLIRNWKKLNSTWDRQIPNHCGLMLLREPSVRLRRVHHVKWFVLDIPRSYGITFLNWKAWFAKILPLESIQSMVKYHKLSWKYKHLISVIFVNSLGINE